MGEPTYDLFFTGQDDPRNCVVIGEDTKPVFFSFETFQRDLSTRTMVSKASKDLIASLEWSPGTHSGMVNIGTRQLLMSQLVLPGSSSHVRNFVSGSDGRTYEWRRCYPDTSGYDLFLLPNNMRIAAFRKMNAQTVVGPSHALLQYQFAHDPLLLEALLSLCIFRLTDLHGL
ncbi:hypothetical protein EV359DRAFT_41907 [Lentinula novae-zelandiae]|uniref:DUF6593 domain-containing protein n=1 Tax=Lentinula lateritia TaxID=40482 RepID=A0ABQ8VP59_9AGAR|nr:hypothetical protein EV359DRAFT_41907 [Lentinula novae-zelandiae]KAJ4495622.1 hypothetical protein C8R41DRAFT_762365 [Lentinula lateritia]